MRALLASAVLLSIAGATVGCSLVLPRLAAPECDVDGDCEQFNVRFPERVTVCDRYQCNEATDRCFLGPLDRDGDSHYPVLECEGDDCDDTRADVFGGRAESCDGIDNDCDDVIDDATPIERAAGVALAGIGTLSGLSWTADASGAMALASVGASASLVDIEATTGTTRGVSIAALPRPDATGHSLSGVGCPSPSTGAPSPSCRLDRVALSVGEPMGWAAFVNRDGCDDGQLRVGLLDVATARIELMGPDARSNTWRGVDLVGACTRTASGTGATAPAIASASAGTPSTPATALVAWVRDTTRRACPAGPAEVAALGLWRATGAVEGTLSDWVVATGGGAPDLVGMTSGVAPPALIATGTGEVIVAFGDAAGGVRIAIVEALPTVAAAPNPATTPGLTLGESVVVGSGNADSVALSLSPAPGGGLRIGVAWTTECGSGGLRFASVVWQRAARTLTPGTPVDLASTGARQPNVAYVAHGFVRSTLVRGGAAVGDDDGGWLVAWRDESMSPPAVVAARVLGVDGSVLDSVALPFARDLSSDPRQPFLYSGPPGETERVLRVGFHAVDAEALVGATLLCQAAP